MIKSNLGKILNKKSISVRDLSLMTGINRASLSQLVNNESKMIKFDTLDKLIRALSVRISDLLTYEESSDFIIDNFTIDREKHTFGCDVSIPEINLKLTTLGAYAIRDELHRIKWPYLKSEAAKSGFELVYSSTNSTTISFDEFKRGIDLNDTITSIISAPIVKQYADKELGKTLMNDFNKNQTIIFDFQLNSFLSNDDLKKRGIETDFIRHIYTINDLNEVLGY